MSEPAGYWERAQSGHLETWEAYARHDVRSSDQRGGYWRAILDAIAAREPIADGERILDIGCGLDTVFDFLPRASGYTLDSLMHRLSPLELSPHARHCAGMLERLPFRDASFDRVLLMNVLDHVLDPAAGLAEIARVLRPGGMLVLSVDTYAGRRYAEKRLHKWWARRRGARTKHPWVFSVRSVQSALAAAALEPSPSAWIPGTKQRRTFFTARKPAGGERAAHA